MPAINLKDVAKYVEINVDSFHAKRLEKLEKLDFKDVLKRKNPYLFRAKNIYTAHDLVKNLLDAYLQSQEETLFGDFIEGVAIFVCQKVYGGIKSTDLIGIDLEFTKDGVLYIVEIKSGPNWANSSQIKRMQDNFRNAIAVLKKKNPKAKIIAMNGCCYGIENQPNKDDYFKYCGQEFWEFISNDNQLYINIIEPFGHKAQEKNEEFMRAYAKVINTFTLKFAQEFCDDGTINWEKIIAFNSKKQVKV